MADGGIHIGKALVHREVDVVKVQLLHLIQHLTYTALRTDIMYTHTKLNHFFSFPAEATVLRYCTGVCPVVALNTFSK